MLLQKRHIIFSNLNIDIDTFSMSTSIVENCIKQIFRCKQTFRFVELTNIQFKIEFLNAFFYIFVKEY